MARILVDWIAKNRIGFIGTQSGNISKEVLQNKRPEAALQTCS